MIRFFDLFFSSIAIILFSPLLLFMAFLLLCTGEHKIFYRQKRVGLNGVSFNLLKFATMLVNSPNLPGGDITSGNDPRVLPIGKFLRKTKLNELPQLVNVILGDISLVGPRPLTPNNFSFYDKKTQKIIKKVKPGLTGIGSIVFRDEESIIQNSHKNPVDCYKEDISPYKGKLESWFIEKQTPAIYFTLIFLTANSVLFPSSKLVWKFFKDLPHPSNDLFNSNK
ncbi:sugar transferase [Opitutales bacterium]|nr:sugar transferase [Opitutales bacterium]